MSLPEAIAKNTTYLSVSSLLQKILAFGFFTYLAHQLDDGLGAYSFALNFTSIFVILMNFGLVPVLTREGARDGTKDIAKYLNFVLAVKVALTAVSIVILVVVFSILNFYSPLPIYTVSLVYVAIIIITLDTFRSVFLAALRARQEMQYEAIGQFVYQVIVVSLGSIVLLMGYKAMAILGVIIIASAYYLIYSMYIVMRKLNYRPTLDWHGGSIMQLLKIAAPFALADVFFKLNGALDTVMLEYLGGDRTVAWYTIALKLTITLTVIPGAFATAFFPAMSRAFKESISSLKDIFERTSQYLFLLSVPIAIGTYVLADDIIALAFPKFPAATIALEIFMTSVIFLFANYPIGNLLNAANKQGVNTLNMGIALVVNVILNVILIPQYTYVGATVAAVCSTVVLVTLGLPHVYKIIHFNVRYLLLKFFQTTLAGLGMAVVVFAIEQLDWSAMATVITSLIVGGICYVILLFVTHGLSRAEIKSLWTALKTRQLSKS